MTGDRRGRITITSSIFYKTPSSSRSLLFAHTSSHNERKHNPNPNHSQFNNVEVNMKKTMLDISQAMNRQELSGLTPTWRNAALLMPSTWAGGWRLCQMSGDWPGLLLPHATALHWFSGEELERESSFVTFHNFSFLDVHCVVLKHPTEKDKSLESLHETNLWTELRELKVKRYPWMKDAYA